jgi:methyl-accepting chemotaxis protein
MGFAGVLAITAIIGLIAVYSMREAANTSHKLVSDLMPQNAFCDELAVSLNVSRLNIRTYQYTGNIKNYETAVAELEKMVKTLKEAREFAQKHNLSGFQKNLDEIAPAIEGFMADTRRTREANDQITRTREVMFKAFEQYTQLGDEYFDDQGKKLDADIKAKAAEEILANRSLKLQQIKECLDRMDLSSDATAKTLASQDTGFLKVAQANKEDIAKRIETIKSATTKENDLNVLNQMIEQSNKYHDQMQKLQIEMNEGVELGKRRSTWGEKSLALVDASMETAIKQTSSGAATTDENLTNSSRLIVICLIVALVAGVAVSWFITAGLVSRLSSIISGLAGGAEQVAAASGQVASASQSLASGASESASSLEETSASLEEMSGMTRQNSDNARQANTLAVDASNAAEQGRDATQRMSGEINAKIASMSEAIQQIKNSTAQTARIIKTIDEIAFQTNLLALNAAVEAARAGEAGKGFAVVAEEVRNLAMRSAEAARNTSALIEEAQKNADRGVAVTGDVAESLKRAVEVEIAKGFQNTVDAVTRVKQLVAEVAAASEEQSKGIGQVNEAVSQMDKITQGNAANAEESASASEELSAQAREMAELVRELSTMVGHVNAAGSTAHVPAAPAVERIAPRATVKPVRVTSDNGNGHHNGKNGHANGNGHSDVGNENKSAATVKAKSTSPNRIKKHLDTKGVKPEQVIPLTDDEMKDF